MSQINYRRDLSWQPLEKGATATKSVLAVAMTQTENRLSAQNRGNQMLI